MPNETHHPIPPEYVYGAVSVQAESDWIQPWRLPHDRINLFPAEGLVNSAAACAGVRVRFATEAGRLTLVVEPEDEPRQYDLVIDNRLVQGKTLQPGADRIEFADLPMGTKVVEVWLDQRTRTRLRGLELPDGLAPAPAPDERANWVTYGSSITHCTGAHSPARTWPAIVARRHDLHLTCLGFGGQCHLDALVGRVIRDLPADLISLKLGINVMGGCTLNERTFETAVIGLVQIIREKHPGTPIAMISPIVSPPRETTPNSVQMTLQIMRHEIADAAMRLSHCGDGKLSYVSGLDLFGPDLVERFLPDGLHPNADGYVQLAENFSRVVMERAFGLS